MNTVALPSSRTAAWWQQLTSRLLFKFVLPRIQRSKLEGIELDVSKLSSLMKNHIRTGRTIQSAITSQLIGGLELHGDCIRVRLINHVDRILPAIL